MQHVSSKWRYVRVHLNGYSVGKVVELVEIEGAYLDCVVGDDAWGCYVRIHVRDHWYFFCLIYYEFYGRRSEHLFVRPARKRAGNFLLFARRLTPFCCNCDTSLTIIVDFSITTVSSRR